MSQEIVSADYWYDDDDIRRIIINRLGDRVYIAPAVPNNDELIRDIAGGALVQARAGRPALIPVNSNGNHWTALVVRVKADGGVVGLYNDSFGDPVGGSLSESGKYLAEIKKQVANSEFWDLQVRQQSDGSSCGVFTAENLIALAKLGMDDLTKEHARLSLEKIRDARAIRLLHLKYLKKEENYEEENYENN